jgi:hypothetical protein
MNQKGFNLTILFILSDSFASGLGQLSAEIFLPQFGASQRNLPQFTSDRPQPHLCLERQAGILRH